MQFLRKYRRGDAGYYEPHRDGEVSFWYDSGRWIYATEDNLRALKQEVLAAFRHDRRDQNLTVSGQFPSYDIEEVR